MPYELFVALRYLFARRKQAFISVISLVSMLGVTVGVMALVIALSLMTGLQQGVRDRMLGSQAHVYVWKPGGIADYRAEAARLEQMADVLGAAPALMGKALISKDDQQSFITLKGIDPALESKVTDIAGAVTEQAVTKQKGLELTVRLDNGQYIAVTQAADETFVVGDAVKILGSGGTSRVTRRN